MVLDQDATLERERTAACAALPIVERAGIDRQRPNLHLLIRAMSVASAGAPTLFMIAQSEIPGGARRPPPCGTLRGFMHRFDKLAKDLGQAALAPSGVTVVSDPMTPETQYADLRHEPDPARQAARDRLGLLGRIAGRVCLLEVYSDAPSAEEFRACLAKHLAHWQARARQARRQTKAPPASSDPSDPVGDVGDAGGAPTSNVPAVAPFLWVIAAGTPTTLITELPLVPAADWPSGVYGFGGDVLRVGLVAARELPRDRTTLLVRLMAAGPLLAPAVPELAQLPPDAPERAVAEPLLLEHRPV